MISNFATTTLTRAGGVGWSCIRELLLNGGAKELGLELPSLQFGNEQLVAQGLLGSGRGTHVYLVQRGSTDMVRCVRAYVRYAAFPLCLCSSLFMLPRASFWVFGSVPCCA